MGRGRGKGKKQLVIAARDDAGSGEGEDEKMPSRRRGRPQKPLKDETVVEDEVDKIEEEEEENSQDSKSSGLNRSNNKNLAATENGRKRKRIRPSQVNGNADLVKEENGVGIKAKAPDLIKSVGFRPNRSRRKNKPRRAAEVGVECK